MLAGLKWQQSLIQMQQPDAWQWPYVPARQSTDLLLISANVARTLTGCCGNCPVCPPTSPCAELSRSAGAASAHPGWHPRLQGRRRRFVCAKLSAVSGQLPTPTPSRMHSDSAAAAVHAQTEARSFPKHPSLPHVLHAATPTAITMAVTGSRSPEQQPSSITHRSGAAGHHRSPDRWAAPPCPG